MPAHMPPSIFNVLKVQSVIQMQTKKAVLSNKSESRQHEKDIFFFYVFAIKPALTIFIGFKRTWP